VEGMWTPCPIVLDEPVKICGLEPEDFGLVLTTPLFISLLCDVLVSFGCGLAVGAALYLTKRGKPPGALLHGLHRLELTRLPGILPPTEHAYSPW
jgi:hypothetical protein